MRRYILTPTLYEKLLSRGMHLVCRRCEMPIHPTYERDLKTGGMIPTEVVSKRSLYRQWQCTHCKYKFGKRKPADLTKCPMCETEGPIRVTSTGKRKIEPIIHDMGRKFYCGTCHDSMICNSNDEDNGEAIAAGMVMLFGI